ncbi:MAG: cytidylate kinase-like family protein [Anaerolineae bacterium]
MIITLSRQLGSEGDTIAARVATALGLTLIDRERVHERALAAGVPAELLQRLMYEGKRSLAAEIMDTFSGPAAQREPSVPSASPLLSVFAPLLPPAAMSLEEAVRMVGLVIKDLASHDNVLILGQGGQCWLRGYPAACHVQIVAPLDVRVARVAAREHLSLAAARRRVRASDQARAEYLLRFHEVRWLDPLLYHLVINTGQTSVEAAVSLVVHAAHAVAQNL